MSPALLALACTPEPTGGGPAEAPVDPDSLAALGLLEWDGAEFTYADGVESYRLGTPLFSDFASKDRAIRVPEGEVVTYVAPGVLSFPLGTVIVKSFSFPADLRAPEVDRRVIETRVLTLEADGWDTWPYLWDEDQTGAVKAPSGAVLDLSVVGLDGAPLTFPYLVPQRNQCVDCHAAGLEGDTENVPIGPTARNLDVDGQLERWADAGWLVGLPALERGRPATDATTLVGVDPATLPDQALFDAARDYLDINCAHCHNPAGDEGRSSQLFLNWDNEDQFRLGLCKKPGSAGNGTGGFVYDIVPGHPEESILRYRMETVELGEMMPDLGRGLVDAPGVALVSEWIRRLEGECSE
ncbi:MAG: hypothetical protein ABMA64_28120 [Myxococcota bacterium]